MIDLYAMHIAQGHEIQCCVITSGTIKWYLMAAVAISEANKLPDPRLNSRGTTPPCVNRVLEELRHWEAMPNCREPVKVAMLQQLYALYTIQHEDSWGLGSCDWNILGIYYGFRLGE